MAIKQIFLSVISHLPSAIQTGYLINMETFKENLIKKLGKEGFSRVQASRIGIAGCGGLGSNCALNLVRAGFKKLTIVDFDVVTAPNLDRQFYFFSQIGKLKVDALKENLLQINPELELTLYNQRIVESNVDELFHGCNIIAECLDTAEYKSLLVSRLLGVKALIVAVSGLGGYGSSDEIKVHKIKNNLIMIGDLASDISQKPALSPRVNIAAAKQADTILDYILNRPQQ
jgi:sulfur carrier protein ThiS adenylyltransferase